MLSGSAVASDQPVVQSWPYRFIRHPAYSGTLLTMHSRPIFFRSKLILNVNYQAAIFAVQDASRIAFELYGIRAQARSLPGEHDSNFYLKTVAGQEFVLKVTHPEEQRNNL